MKNRRRLRRLARSLNPMAGIRQIYETEVRRRGKARVGRVVVVR